MADMTATDKVLADLPKIGQIAVAPSASNPLVAMLIQYAAQQGTALAQIAQWTQDARQALDGERQPDPVPTVAEALGLPDDATVELVPARNGRK